MRKNTIKWRIFKYNLTAIVMLIILVAIAFNIIIRSYIKKDILAQLGRISSRVEDTILRQEPDFFQFHRRMSPNGMMQERKDDDNLRITLRLMHSLRQPLSFINADYLLFSQDMNVIITFDEEAQIATDLITKIKDAIENAPTNFTETNISFSLLGIEYLSVIKPLKGFASSDLGYIAIYSNLEKVNQLQYAINWILIAILFVSAGIIGLFSSVLSKKISEPFSSLNEHIKAIAGRNFSNKLDLTVSDELKELVKNINLMSDKLEIHDKAQKTFLQNISHEFKTPLMSIQGYAEGIVHQVVEKDVASKIIVEETHRLTKLVEDLLYLSRLEAINENYDFDLKDFNFFLKKCTLRVEGIALKNHIHIGLDLAQQKLMVPIDEEKLSRAITNILENSIRYAKSRILLKTEIETNVSGRTSLKISISDDGPGFKEEDLPHLFERFFKGENGCFGLGLAISKTIIEKHNGCIVAKNLEHGALFEINLPRS
jgi:two-component system, OmpR family, sensor histidine kinase CssS